MSSITQKNVKDATDRFKKGGGKITKDQHSSPHGSISSQEMKRLKGLFRNTLTDRQKSELMAASLKNVVGNLRRRGIAVADPEDQFQQYHTNEHADEYRDRGPTPNQDAGDHAHAAARIMANLKKQGISVAALDPVIEQIAGMMGDGTDLMGLRSAFKSSGLFRKIDFVTSPMPMWMLELKRGGKKVAVLNKKYADDVDHTVGNLAVGYFG